MRDKSFRVKGDVDIDVIDHNGVVREHRSIHNRVVDSGLELLASLVAGEQNDDQYIGRPTHCAIGSDSTDVTSEDTTLAHEVFRNQFDSVKRTNNNVEFVTTFQANQPESDRTRIEEVGLFNGASGGTMLSRAVFAPINKYRDDVVRINWVLTFNYVPSQYDTVWDDTTP